MAAARRFESAGADERLRRSLEIFLATMDANRPFVIAAAEAFAQATRNDAVRDRLAAEYRQARAQVATDVAAAAAGQLHSADADSVAAVLLALFDGLAIQWLLARRDVPDADHVMRGLEGLASAVTQRPGMGRG